MTKTKTGTTRCGWCLTGHHPNCNGLRANGSTCTCTCQTEEA